MLDKIVRSKLFENYRDVILAVSPRLITGEKDPFNFNLSFSVDQLKERVLQNRIKFFNAVGIEYSDVAYQKQTHSTIVKIVNESGFQGESDAMITDKKNLALAVSVADCVPVLIYDKTKKVIAAVHSGWRGTQKRILPETLNKLKMNFGSKMESLLIFIGPSICRKHYQVGEDVAKLFSQEFVYVENGRLYLDVAGVNYSYLLKAGVPPENIELSGLCTYETLHLHSFRRDKEKSGRGMAVIMMKGAVQ